MQNIEMESSEEVQVKLKELRTHVPFVERMISKIAKGSNPRSQSQQQRLQGLHSFLTKPMSKAPKMEMLLKMEAVLNSMKDKVQKAESNRPGSHQSSANLLGFGDSNSGQISERLGTSQDRNLQKSLSKESSSTANYATSSSGTSHESDKVPSRSDLSDRSLSKEMQNKSRDHVSRGERHRIHSGDWNRESFERSLSSPTSKGFEKSKIVLSDSRIRTSTDRETERHKVPAHSLKDMGSLIRDKGKDTNYERSSGVKLVEGKDNRHPQRSQGYSDVRHDDIKHSSKRNSLLDLPMPPSAPSGSSTANPHNRRSENEARTDKDKFLSSREKLQRLFGISGESSKSPQIDKSPGFSSAKVEEHSGWRDNVKARNSLVVEANHGVSEDIVRRDTNYGKQRSHCFEKSNVKGFNQMASSKSTNQGLFSMVHPENDPRRPSASHSRLTNEATIPVADSPMSPIPSPDISAMDTPQSPDQEASFSPVIDSEEPSPVKTIPLQKQGLQGKGVDLDAIRKALAQIQSSEKSKTGVGPSYRYEDFVGPAAKDDEPYDPEEVWKSINSAPKPKHSTPSPSQRDVDLRQIPQAFPHRGTELPNQSFNASGKDIDSRKLMLGQVSQIPLPQRPSSSSIHTSQSSVTHVGSSPQSKMRSSAWDQDSRIQRPGDPRIERGGHSGDIDMRYLHFRSHQTSASPQSAFQARQLNTSSFPSLPRQPPLPSSVHPPLPPPPLPESPQPPQPPLPRSPPPTVSEGSEKESKIETPGRLDHIRSKIAQNAGEFIRPGQRGVAASQMEKYKLKRQSSNEIKSPPHSMISSKESSKKAEVNIKSSSSASVLDILLPESSSKSTSSALQQMRDPVISEGEASVPLRDPRLASSESKLGKEESQIRDPRLSLAYGKSENYSSKSSTVRDPRQELGKAYGSKDKEEILSPKYPESKHSDDVRDPRKMPSSSMSVNRETSSDLSQIKRGPRQEIGMMNRDPRKDLGNVSRDPRKEHAPRDPRQDPKLLNRDPRHELVLKNRDPRQEFGAVTRDPRQSLVSLSREPRQDVGPYTPTLGTRDPRKDSGGFTKSASQPFRDPRLMSRSDKPSGSVWAPNSQSASSNFVPSTSQNRLPTFVPPSSQSMTSNFSPTVPSSSVSISREIIESDPLQSASGCLIGQTYTCLMMRGLPYFVNSHHIYRFFEEYILRDISIELDNNYNCKGTAYVHFPSHASAREALEKMNGYLLHGSPISLRICTVGILRQAKNAYEQLNRDREARLGLPERPRGNANPFYKPRPKEAPPATPSVPPVSIKDKSLIVNEVDKKRTSEKENAANSGRYSDLCGVKVNSAPTSSFKIPKIKKSDAEKVNCKGSSNTTSRVKQGDELTNKDKPKASSSVNKGGKIDRDKKVIKEAVVNSSESDSDAPLEKPPKVKTKSRIKKLVIDSDSESEPERTKNIFSVKNEKVKESVKIKEINNKPKQVEKAKMSSSSDDSDSDIGSMVIDESAHSSDGDESSFSETSSAVSEKIIEQSKETRAKPKNQTSKPPSKITSKKVKPVKKSAKPKTPKGSSKKKAPYGKITKTPSKPRQSFGNYADEFDLQSGIKLTRHTQGELEELIPLQNKLKVLIPVPHKMIVALFEDDKTKKRITKRKVIEEKADESLPLEEEKKVREEPSEGQEIVEILAKKPLGKKKVESKKKVAVKKKEIPKQIMKAKLPGYSRGIIPPVLEEQIKLPPYRTPTLRCGQKRKRISLISQRIWKKAKRIKSELQLFRNWNGSSLTSSVGNVESDCSMSEKDTETKRPAAPNSGNLVAKRPRFEKDDVLALNRELLGFQESHSGLDVFENSNISDEMSDLTQLTPSLLEVDPAICNALPNASVLANVLSPPLGPQLSSECPIPSISEFVEDSTLTDLDSSRTDKINSFSEKGDADKNSEHTAEGIDNDDITSDKGNDDDSLSETVNQLVESLGESLLKEDMSPTKDYEKIENKTSVDTKEISCANVKSTIETDQNMENKAPAKVEDTENKVPAKVRDMENKVPAKVEDMENKVPAKVEDMEYKVPAKVENIENKVPVKVEDTTEEITKVLSNEETSSLIVDNENSKISEEHELKNINRESEISFVNTSITDKAAPGPFNWEASIGLLDQEDEEKPKVDTSIADETTKITDIPSELTGGSSLEVDKPVMEKALENEPSSHDKHRTENVLSTQQNIEKSNETISEQSLQDKPYSDPSNEMERKGSGMLISVEHMTSKEDLPAPNIKIEDSGDQPLIGTSSSETLNLTDNSSYDKSSGQNSQVPAGCVTDADSQLHSQIDQKCSDMLTLSLDTETYIKPDINKAHNNESIISPKKDVVHEECKIAGTDGFRFEAVCESSAESTLKEANFHCTESTVGTSKNETLSVSPLTSKATDMDGINFTDRKEEENPDTIDYNGSKGLDRDDLDDDDAVSVGRMSTSSFVDDASIVSSEGRELKTPDSEAPKKVKKNKPSVSLIPPECRRVTRGSLVEPRVTEVTEWDDGGVIDLFQCDLCDYVGRHRASHLINYHMERELPCEFKKEDFGPVLKDHVGPAKDRDIYPSKLDLEWIPKAMTFTDSVTCKKCDYFSNSRFDLIYHFLEHNPTATESVYHCRLCNYMSEIDEDFYNHVSSHTGEYRYSCDLCGHKTYKESLLKEHHKDSHQQQSPKFSVSHMIEEDGWFYIHVCKVCMFVRIRSEAAEEHLQRRHSGKADIHKANMSRPIILHSELRKPSESESVSAVRTKSKGKKKKKGKKGPDLDVFVGEEDEKDVKEEVEVKAKQLVDRIASNMHTTTSAQLAHKRMSLLNTIFKKLDTDKEDLEAMECEKSMESLDTEAKITEGTVKEKSETSADESNTQEISVSKVLPPIKSSGITHEKGSEEERETVSDIEKKGYSLRKRNKVIADEVVKERNTSDSDTDTSSTLSGFELPSNNISISSAENSALKETIMKLSAQLEVVKKEEANNEKKKNEEKEKLSGLSSPAPLVSQRKSSDFPDDDSDSDALVICEDADDEVNEVETLEDKEVYSGTAESFLQSTIQSILREAANVSKPATKIPQLRVRPTHQLIDPQFEIVSKMNKETNEYCVCSKVSINLENTSTLQSFIGRICVSCIHYHFILGITFTRECIPHQYLMTMLRLIPGYHLLMQHSDTQKPPAQYTNNRLLVKEYASRAWFSKLIKMPYRLYRIVPLKQSQATKLLHLMTTFT
ncbi:hypothetical protein SK128_011964 [Halocaridina rubra]|uniref:Protein hunchback n=1 Tax=Halocaridina rubra TaxID=373956 RepID=A0AAN9A687_HALRR